MGVEVERKFLIVGEQWRERVLSSQVLAQGYLASSPTCLVRVRAGEDTGWVTVKGASARVATAGALVRSEFEWEIPLEQAREMLSHLALSAVEKTRFVLDCSPGQWTVDEFGGANGGLTLLEIEGEDVAALERAQLPAWVGEEVSADDRYSNAYLSRHPYATWC